MRKTITPPTLKQPSAMVKIRELLPDGYEVFYPELPNILERQAECLLNLSGYDPEVQLAVSRTHTLSIFPRIKVIYTHELSVSGASYWNGSEWLIFISRKEAQTRQRFTFFHELAHILQHGRAGELFTGRDWLPEVLRREDAKRQCERAADYFAAATLMPKRAVIRLYENGVRTPEVLAAKFKVSPEAMRIRLEQLNLVPKAWLYTRGRELYSVPEKQNILQAAHGFTVNHN